MKIIFIDKNKSLVEEVKKLFYSGHLSKDIELEAREGDIFEAQKKEHGYICTASNPDFDMAGGLDKEIKERFPKECISPFEFLLTNNLLFLISVNKERKADKKIIKRALSYLFLKFNNTDKTFYLSGIGTGRGGLDIFDFTSILQKVMEADYRGVNLSWAGLSKADLSGAYLEKANLEGANLQEANLEAADLSESNLEAVNLIRANLEGACLNDTDLSHANLEGANLQGANLQAAKLIRADLQAANLKRANLLAANLSVANLKKAVLEEANLEGANLSWADLREADLSGANLSKTEYDGMTVSELIEKYKLEVDEKGFLTLYKRVQGRRSPSTGEIIYKKGETIAEEFCNFRAYNACASGLHVFATKELADKWMDGDTTLKVKVYIGDFVAIPKSGDGKIRVKKLTVLE